MSERKIFLLTVCSVAAAVLLIGSVSYVVNGWVMKSDRLVSNMDARKYNSVIIKRFKFDSAIVGSSLSQGFKCSEFDKVWGGYSQKLTFSGANPAEIDFLVDKIAGKQKIRRIMIDILIPYWGGKADLKEIPVGLYGEEAEIERFKNSFSINAVVEAYGNISGFLQGKMKFTDRDSLYDWNRKRKCGEKFLAENLLYGTEKGYEITEENAGKTLENVREFLVPMLKRHKECEFILFFPPPSVLFYRNTELKAYCSLKSKVADMLLELPNVKLFCFETAFDVMGNCDNYKDLTHYSGKVNSWILECMKNNKFRLTAENKAERLALFCKYTGSYDFRKTLACLEKKYGRK